MQIRHAWCIGLLVVAIAGCSAAEGEPAAARRAQAGDGSQSDPQSAAVDDAAGEGENPDEEAIRWAIVVHGGAGKPPEGLPPEQLDAFKLGVQRALTEALTAGRDALAEGKPALDAVELAVRVLEVDPRFNAGRGSVLNIEGEFEMHASIMDGRTRDCGAVAAVDTIQSPIAAARRVMSATDFILLVGEGAERFAVEQGFEPVAPDHFRTELRHNNWLKAREALKLPKLGRASQTDTLSDDTVGTVGCVALDADGNLAAATSTGGVAHKRAGRMGDSSIIGAGNYADNRTCAVSCTGIGEHFIRNSVAFHVHALMHYSDWSLEKAARHVIDEVLKDDTGGLIAVDRRGTISMIFNRDGMRRAAADSSGRFEVKYWE